VRDICYCNVSFPLQAQQVRLNEKKKSGCQTGRRLIISLRTCTSAILFWTYAYCGPSEFERFGQLFWRIIRPYSRQRKPWLRASFRCSLLRERNVRLSRFCVTPERFTKFLSEDALHRSTPHSVTPNFASLILDFTQNERVSYSLVDSENVNNNPPIFCKQCDIGRRPKLVHVLFIISNNKSHWYHRSDDLELRWTDLNRNVFIWLYSSFTQSGI